MPPQWGADSSTHRMESSARISVLLPGPTSYLGRRLLLRLLERPELHVRVLVMDRRGLGDLAELVSDIVEGNPADLEVLARAAVGVDVAFCPVRFVSADPAFEALSRVFPERFRDACIAAGVRRIIYLGPLGRAVAGNATLAQMFDAGGVLTAHPDRIQAVWFRAGFILGSGSLLFEALRNLVQKVPVLPTPRWMEAKVSAIGVRDVLDYLVRAIHLPLDGSVEVEIGLEPRSFRALLADTASAMGLRRLFLPLPFPVTRLSPVVLMLLTPFSARLAGLFIEMVETLDAIAGEFSDETARRLFPEIQPASFQVAMGRVIQAIEHEQVVSRWTDSMGSLPDANVEQEMSRSVFRDVRRERFGAIPPERIFRAVTSIGGQRGWFRFDLLWRVRGLMDKLAGGFGGSVGRRTQSDLRVGDVLDVWRVIDLQPNRRLLLAAHMKTFGKAWLEFRIEGDELIQTAYHYPKGLMGRLYWYSMLPFHAFIFPDMIRSIVRQAAR
jgi:uncharacterized protein YbjT (DUF2867 family)